MWVRGRRGTFMSSVTIDSISGLLRKDPLGELPAGEALEARSILVVGDLDRLGRLRESQKRIRLCLAEALSAALFVLVRIVALHQQGRASQASNHTKLLACLRGFRPEDSCAGLKARRPDRMRARQIYGKYLIDIFPNWDLAFFRP
jgi:hypothetical protein